MWETVKLEDIADVKAGNPAPQDKNLFEHGVYPFVRTSDVGKVKVGSLSDANDKLNQQGIAKLKLFPKGTILFPKSGASTFLNHRVILEMDAYVASHLATIKSKQDDVSDKYLWYFLQNIDAADLVADSAYPSLNTKTIQSIPISLPPLLEQERIVAKLDDAFTEIDGAIEAIKHKQENARKLYEAIARDIFFNKKNKVPLKEIAKIIMGQSPKGESYNSAGIGSVLINGPVEFEKDSFGLTKSIKFTTAPTKFCEMGDALLCVRGSTTGRMNIAREHACIGRGVAAIRANQNQDWINYFIQSSRTYIYSIGTGATFPNVSSKQIENIEIYYPSIEEQESLLTRLSGSYSETKRYAELTKNILNNYKALKLAILAQELQSSEAA